VTLIANGSFEVKLDPQPLSSIAETTGLGRMSLNKQFHGDLEAISQGEMLAFRSSVQGSAGYVAMETVRGVLSGRRGSFVLQHSSTMTRGQPEQSISVVPDSGTDELRGITGKMVITIANGLHTYSFEYTLPESQQ
jgi:hypothetical protein